MNLHSVRFTRVSTEMETVIEYLNHYYGFYFRQNADFPEDLEYSTTINPRMWDGPRSVHVLPASQWQPMPYATWIGYLSEARYQAQRAERNRP